MLNEVMSMGEGLSALHNFLRAPCEAEGTAEDDRSRWKGGGDLIYIYLYRTNRTIIIYIYIYSYIFPPHLCVGFLFSLS